METIEKPQETTGNNWETIEKPLKTMEKPQETMEFYSIFVPMSVVNQNDTIVALATPPGVSAIAIVRLSGEDAIEITNTVFKGINLTQVQTHTLHYGYIVDEDRTVDEVMVSVFHSPNSYTKENSTEISCHGSTFIVEEIIKTLMKNGARLAQPGEFTRRAFLNGRFDLAQAEAVADLIHSDSEMQRQAAMHQLKGGVSKRISALRTELIHFASMIELELDFSEEDVEFASRDDLSKLVSDLNTVLDPLIESFKVGNAIRQGIPTVIAGKPNAGKSTLLNALLQEEKAIVSDIPGTTRDVIEDVIVLEGIQFRFIDTAGLRETTDVIEAIGVERTQERLKQASLIIYMIDLSFEFDSAQLEEIETIKNYGIPFILVGNKTDQAKQDREVEGMLRISALDKDCIELLKKKILETVQIEDFKTGDTVVTNLRHYENLRQTRKALDDVMNSIQAGMSNDLLALDIRNALHYLGEITGEITTEDLLENIFSKFCIGK